MKYLPLLLFTLSSITVSANYKFTGVAKSKKGKILYIENHTVTEKNNKIIKVQTKYFNIQKKEFANIQSDFSKNPYLPDYTFTDTRFDKMAKLILLKNKANATSKKNKKTQSKVFDLKPNLITGQGLYNYVLSNYDLLTKQNKTLVVKFLMPQNLDTYTFRIYKLKTIGSRSVFRIEIKSWFLRLFAPNINVEIDNITLRLMKYYGASNLMDNNNQVQNVTIEYSYKQNIE